MVPGGRGCMGTAMARLDLLWRLLPRGRDGRARSLEAPAVAAAAPLGPRLPTEGERALTDGVATKLLGGWLANRQQTLMPHTLNFRALPPEQSGLLVAVMAAAALADGRAEAARLRQLPMALRRAGAGEGEEWELGRALAEPRPLPPLLAEVQEAGLSSHAYAAALMAADGRSRAGRAFLDYLAARLGLSPRVAGSLERRYRA